MVVHAKGALTLFFERTRSLQHSVKNILARLKMVRSGRRHAFFLLSSRMGLFLLLLAFAFGQTNDDTIQTCSSNANSPNCQQSLGNDEDEANAKAVAASIIAQVNIIEFFRLILISNAL